MKKKTSTHSIVPVLFTLGVIGWGFFAIDRLTTSSSDTGKWAAKQNLKVSHNSSGLSQPSWKKSLEAIVLNLHNISPKHNNGISEQTVHDLPIVSDDSLSWQREDLETRKEEISNKLETIDQIGLQKNSFQLFFYKEKGDDLILTSITRKLNSNVSINEVFTSLLRGPEIVEQELNFIDSFPVKPTLIDAQLESGVLMLNFDENFGRGVSYKTINLQIQQLWYTAKQFEGIESIKILIYGKPAKDIGGDGISIPDRINEVTWPVALHN
jgi:spore germination protein GerM